MSRGLIALVMMFVLAACGTRRATVTYAALAGVSGGLVLVSKASACDGGHSECDRVGPAVMQGVFLTGMVIFGVAALVSAVATPSSPPR